MIDKNLAVDDALLAMRALEGAILSGEPASRYSGSLKGPLAPAQQRWLDERLNGADMAMKLRLYHYVGVATGDVAWTDQAFDALYDVLLEDAFSGIARQAGGRIAAARHGISLPLRANLAGGWSDVPPYCNEKGGTVLNAAIRLNGQNPVRVGLTRLAERHVVLESVDLRARQVFDSIEPLQRADAPGDAFALHKAALLASGVIPLKGGALDDVLEDLGGGFALRTEVSGVPTGSGLGTSCILSAACIKALLEFTGHAPTDEALCRRVMTAEQLMSTGGGWEDQLGALRPGVKLLSSPPGIRQDVTIQGLELEAGAMEALRQRYTLIYTGQTRQTKRILRDILGGYIGNEPHIVQALEEIQRMAVLMRDELAQGRVDGFAALMNRHWEQSRRMDAGCTNARIERIFEVTGDLLDGKMCVGSGGGGFLQVMMKPGVTRRQLDQRLRQAFEEESVATWDCGIV